MIGVILERQFYSKKFSVLHLPVCHFSQTLISNNILPSVGYTTLNSSILSPNIARLFNNSRENIEHSLHNCSERGMS